MQVKLAE